MVSHAFIQSQEPQGSALYRDLRQEAALHGADLLIDGVSGVGVAEGQE